LTRPATAVAATHAAQVARRGAARSARNATQPSVKARNASGSGWIVVDATTAPCIDRIATSAA
jgi:hypothetical protein